MSKKDIKSKKTVSPNSAVNTTTLKKSPKWFYLIALLIPILFFIILEFSLRLFGYGQDISQWIKATDKHYILNPDIAYRYFYSTAEIPYSSKDIFLIDKPKNTFRVFIMGESSAAGFPSGPNGTFPRYINKSLKLLYPDKNIEVVNIAMAAINTYALRDLLPGVIEQKPDLVIFYVGHNEYYGALGVGSMESLGAYRGIVNLMLQLNDYKTVDLLRNTIKYFINLFSSGSKAHSGTLMARMAKDQAIPFNSNIYKLGIMQFEGNMRDMLDILKENKIPSILGNLTCNLLDQKPFISDNESENALLSFNKAKKLMEEGKIEEAKKLFIKAKELDLLRFRAPEEINNVIFNLGKEYGIPVVNIDSAFYSISKYGIPGNDLMTDHLHPTVAGYNYMGKLYFQQMISSNYLPEKPKANLNLQQLDSLTLSNLKFSYLDSVITRYRLTILKSDWPYTDKSLPTHEIIRLFNVRNYIDSLALYVIDDKLSWEKSHRDAAIWYIKHGFIDKFKYEIDLLIDMFPIITDYYPIAYNQLLINKAFDEAYYYLKKEYDIIPNAFNTKWLGIINLSKNKHSESIKYLEESFKFIGNDPQVLYNLAGAYASQQKYSKAYEYISRCMSINPNFPGAAVLYNQLKAIK